MRQTQQFALALLLTASASLAQVKGPAFEVTSVKPHPRGGAVIPPSCTGSHFFAALPVFIIIQWAFDFNRIQQDRLQETLPYWATSVSGSYDLEATIAAPVGEAECKLMVRNLFADRFKFAFHDEFKEGTIYNLVVAPGGLKMQKVKDADPGPQVYIRNNEQPAQSPPPDSPTYRGYTMDNVASFISGLTVPTPVFNKTGVEGVYRMEIHYASRGAVASLEPDIRSAVQQQLGLKLEETKGQISLPVVDHIERPDSN